MEASTSGALSRSVVWLLVRGLLGACLVPLALAVGGLASGSQMILRTVAPFIYPTETTAPGHAYATTTIDDNGASIPAYAFELHYVDANGTTVKDDPILGAFLWEGIAEGFAVLVATILAFLLATPTGVIIGRLLGRAKHSRA